MRTVRCSGRLGGKGVSALGGVCQEAGVHLPPVNKITDRCKNITFPQLRLRTVKIARCWRYNLSLLGKNSVRFSWQFVVTKLVVSGTQCRWEEHRTETNYLELLHHIRDCTSLGRQLLTRRVFFMYIWQTNSQKVPCFNLCEKI